MVQAEKHSARQTYKHQRFINTKYTQHKYAVIHIYHTRTAHRTVLYKVACSNKTLQDMITVACKISHCYVDTEMRHLG